MLSNFIKHIILLLGINVPIQSPAEEIIMYDVSLTSLHFSKLTVGYFGTFYLCVEPVSSLNNE